MKINSIVLVVLCMVSIGIGSRSVGQGLDESIRKSDHRLDTLVTISQQHISVGELLRRISEQANVEINIRPYDVSSGYDLLVECDKTPAGALLDSLYGLVSSRGFEWKWICTGTAPAFKYTLVETPRAKEREERYKKLGQQALEKYIDLMRRLVEMGPSERNRHKKEIRETLGIYTDPASTSTPTPTPTPSSMLDIFLNAEQIWKEARFFFSALSSDQQKLVLENHQPVHLSLPDLPPNIQQQFKDSFESSGTLVKGKDDIDYHALTLPQDFTISIMDPTTLKGQVTPTVLITYSNGIGHTMFGTGFITGMIIKLIRQGWMLPGDSCDNARNHNKLPKITARESGPPMVVVSDDGSTRISRSLDPLYNHLTDIARAGKFPLLAIVAEGAQDTGEPSEAMLGTLLDQMQFGYSQMYKWRNDVLVVNTPRWFITQEAAVPYEQLKQIFSGDNHGVSLRGLAEVNRTLLEANVDWLSRARGLHGLHGLLPLLFYASEHSSIMTPAGSEVSIDDLRFCKGRGYLPVDVPNDKQARLRLSMVNDKVELSTEPRILVERYDENLRLWEAVIKLGVYSHGGYRP